MSASVWPPSASAAFEVTREDSRYPSLLATIDDPPPVLRGFGDPGVLRPGLAVVGARKATPYGLAAARLFAGWAAAAGYPIISGAAIGCDQAAHVAALASGGVTVAVLGCGADTAYPRGSAELLADIVSSGGCVVSELAWQHPPAKWTFRARNRIIAGLAGALLVVEANCPSGTFITADYALDAGREVLVVPGSIFAPESRGPNRLLRQGATPVCEVAELAGVLEAVLGRPTPVDHAQPDLYGLDSDDRVLSALRSNPMRPDDVARTLGLDIVTVARRIGALEGLGLARKYPDGRYGPC
jgi:DNA processing protein